MRSTVTRDHELQMSLCDRVARFFVGYNVTVTSFVLVQGWAVVSRIRVVVDVVDELDLKFSSSTSLLTRTR